MREKKIIPWNRGKKLSKEHKDKLSLAHIGMKQSKETIKKRLMTILSRRASGQIKKRIPQKSSSEKLLARLLGKTEVKKDNECWNWKGAITQCGYGVSYMDGRNIQAHRLSFYLHKGEIPEGMLVCHSCDNRRCVNPTHLWLGTYYDNWMDAVKKGRSIRWGEGENNPWSKLTEKQIDSIFRLSKTKTQTELARQFKCHQTNIHYILSGKKWKNYHEK